MKKQSSARSDRPLSITLLSWLFIALGVVALCIDLLRLIRSGSGHRMPANRGEFLAVVTTHLLALVGGILMLAGSRLGGWIILGWAGFHVVLSLFHSPFQLFVHFLLFAVIAYLVFRRSASEYFRQ